VKLYSDEWQQAWKTALQASADYRAAAQTWEGALVLKVEPDVRIFLDLHKGDCREIRNAVAADECKFELSASRDIWLDLLERGKDPLYMVMRGKLKLLQGSKAQLLPYAKAAKAMLAAAQELQGVDYE
jgi:putative sterol carrier protein